MTWQDEILKGHENDKSIFNTMTTSVTIPNDNASEFEHALTVVLGYEVVSTLSDNLSTVFNVKIRSKSDQNSIEILADQYKK